MKRTYMLLFILAITVTIVMPSSAQEVTSNILTRVFLLKYKNNIGASFTIDIDNRQYLITAKHNVEGIKEGDTIDLMENNGWKSFQIKPLYINNPDIDIIVLVLQIPISKTLDIEPSMGGLILAQNMYFLGFPFGLRMQFENLNAGFPIPIVKSGICSAIIKMNGYQLILVDGTNNPGFSGGPLVFHNHQAKKLMVAGVIKGYRHEEEKIYKKVPSKMGDISPPYELVETDMVIKSNTGIVIAYSIDSAVEIIRKNPIGPIVIK